VDFWAIGALPLGVVLDLALGDPRWMPNPARAIPFLIERAEGGLRVAVVKRGGSLRAELVSGVVLATTIVGLVGGLAWLADEVLDGIGGPTLLIGRSLLIYWGVSLRRIGDELLRVSRAPDLATSRRLAREFAGLDATGLDEVQVNRACLEFIGERSNIAVIAPLFWLAVAGPGGLWSFKAIDALCGVVVKDAPRYRYFGWSSARIDELANFIPCRLTCLLIALSAALLGDDGASALRTGWRQGRRYPHRQGTWGMAAVAGALGVQLGGRASIRAVPGRMPIVGDPIGPIEKATVRRGVRIIQLAGLHAAALAWAFRVVVYQD
jgi:adenosylcobinamide-phosphate synthase